MKKLVSLLSAGLLAFNLLMPVKAENLETRIKASEIQEEITIDGKLGEEAWQKAEKVHGFYFKKENKDAANTLAYICQDKKNLYIAFDCSAKPEEIRATETKRDGIVRDDFAGIMIEP